jgi:hypothetical protein
MATTQQQQLQTFPHRQNADGTFDSICPYCFQTVSQQRLESDLARFEQSHKCRPEEVRVSRIAC